MSLHKFSETHVLQMIDYAGVEKGRLYINFQNIMYVTPPS